MRIFVEIPTWIGDAVMATPAVELIVEMEDEPDLIFFGSYPGIELFKSHPNCHSIIIDNTRDGFRLGNIIRKAEEIGMCDKAFTFRNSFWSGVLLKSLNTEESVGRKKGLRDILIDRTFQWHSQSHQVQKYFSIFSEYYNSERQPGELSLHIPAKNYDNPTIGINPGAAYGSAKRWYPERFAEVAAELSDDYDIMIFGGTAETSQCDEISAYLDSKGISNYKNLSGKTTITELASYIGGLTGFITNDSGPMHIAAAYHIPSVCIFGPTDYIMTSQWKNPKSAIVSAGVGCSPCMKRQCPLGHHECMNKITSEIVLKAFKNIMNQEG